MNRGRRRRLPCWLRPLTGGGHVSEVTASKLRVHNLVVSLDGFATGEKQSMQAPFGHAQPEFQDWFGKIRAWRNQYSDGLLGPAEALASQWEKDIGAEI